MMMDMISGLSLSVYTVWLSLAPLLLIGALIAGVIHILLPPHFIRRALRGRGSVWRAVLIGVPLPLCSCGVIPAGLGLKRDGASQGATVGFLISTPQTGVDSLIVSGHLLGYPFALFKIISAAVMGLVGGSLAEAFAQERFEGVEDVHHSTGHDHSNHTSGRLKAALHHAKDVIEPIWGWVLIGVLVSGLIDQFLPMWTPFESSNAEAQGLWVSYGFALFLSLPLYVCATASVPIAAALLLKGLPLGAALIFLVAGPATNVATMGAVYRALGARALVIYLGTITVGSLISALILDLAFGWNLPLSSLAMSAHEHHFAWWEYALSALLALWFLQILARRIALWWTVKIKNASHATHTKSAEYELAIEGLTCQGCVRRLQEGLITKDQATRCEVNASLDRVKITSQLTPQAMCEAISEIGYQATPAPLHDH